MSADATISLSIDKDAALVLFEWLSELSERDGLGDIVTDASARCALESMLCSLESSLVEPFDPAYGRLLSEAAARLQARARQD